MGVHAIRPVVLDACVLVPQSLCDLLLRLAEDPRLYRPVWTDEILTEAHRALTHKLPKKWTKPQADRWRAAVEAAFPEAMNEPAAGIVTQARNHPGDRHVLAAAIEAGAIMVGLTNPIWLVKTRMQLQLRVVTEATAAPVAAASGVGGARPLRELSRRNRPRGGSPEAQRERQGR